MRVRYVTCDVFTDQRFGGNQLAVIPDASELAASAASPELMQQITREFNYSESTFVLPSTNGCTRQVRIFTPAKEIPFAGHPNVGTAFVLACLGELGEFGDKTLVTFEEQAGTVPVEIRRTANGFRCVLSAPAPLSMGPTLDAAVVASAISVDPAAVVTTVHPPQVASVGLPFVMVETSLDIVVKARPEGIEAQCGNAAEPALLAAANVAAARLLFVAIPIAFEAGQIIEQARRANPALKIVARAHFDAEVAHLAGLGADSVVMGEREIAAAMVRQAFPEPGTAPAAA